MDEEEWRRQKSSLYIGKFKHSWQKLGWETHPNRRIETAMARIRLGCGLNKSHLYKMKLVDSPDCELCSKEETQEHIITECVRHYTQSVILRDKVRQITGTPLRQITLPTILGEGSSQPKQAELAKALITFLMNTKPSI